MTPASAIQQSINEKPNCMQLLVEWRDAYPVVFSFTLGLHHYEMLKILRSSIQRNDALEIIKAYATYPLFSEIDLISERAGESIMCAAQNAQNKEIWDLLKGIFIQKFLILLKEDTLYNYDSLPTQSGITQQDVADYLLKTARALPANQDSIDQIKIDILLLNTEKSSLHIFLRGYVLSRLRTALIRDLEAELKLRILNLNPPVAPPTTQPWTPAAASSRSGNRDADGIEMVSMTLDENDTTNHNNNASYDSGF